MTVSGCGHMGMEGKQRKNKERERWTRHCSEGAYSQNDPICTVRESTHLCKPAWDICEGKGQEATTSKNPDISHISRPLLAIEPKGKASSEGTDCTCSIYPSISRDVVHRLHEMF